MKLVNYKLQTQIEYLSDKKSIRFFKDYLQSILEDTTKPYYQRADYIGLSLNELKTKIDTLSLNIKELQDLKKQLSTSLDLAKQITASMFIDNGIDRIDGNILSSLTLSKPTSKTKTDIKILDENEVMALGYVKFEADLEAIEKALKTEEGKEELKNLVSVIDIEETTPSKIKVNAKKVSVENEDETSILDIEDLLPKQIAA